MRYKQLVSNKIERLSNSISALYSSLSQPSLTRQQLEDIFDRIKEQVAEIQTLINSEQG